MCNGTIMNKLISFSFPLMLSSVLQLMFNAVDIIVVGRFSGRQALAAVGSTTALINIFTNLFIGISLGANVLAAGYFAADKKREMSEAVHTAITFALISGIFMAFVGAGASRLALRLMDTPADVIGQSTTYMRIYFMGMPFFMLYNYGAAVLRAVGDTKRPLLFLMAAGAANVALDLLLVIVIPLDVAGVAIGTVASQMVSSVLVIWCLHRTESSYQLRFSALTIKWKYLKRIFQVGIPAGIQSTVINFSNAMLQSSVNSFGSTAMAGYTATNNILGFLYVAVNSITQACMSFTSQNYSVGKQKRMDRVFLDCVILSVGVGGILGVGAYVFGPQLLKIYTADASVIACGMEILSITTILYFLCGIMDLIPGALRGMGHSAVPMVLSVIGTVGTRIIWIYGFFPHHRSLYFLFISYPGSWIFTIIMQAVCFYFVRKQCRRQPHLTA
ncbi:MAG TPA: MATE family efflux transporter [Candidatus Anaerostipes avistercoris]|uniref:MATE family efflux transporter n=1 Tax=Candidatus Anaerostipes avistercoris TaxID=2838462 RepID=A0A9D2PJY3_9FIRM|nr:MATE family efflux transporter [uncultured Anaerostipes sp.]HJC51446.1 MATE family efflux transporter [Candidatus Anaerostipes avistercoris]